MLNKFDKSVLLNKLIELFALLFQELHVCAPPGGAEHDSDAAVHSDVSASGHQHLHHLQVHDAGKVVSSILIHF